MREEGDEEIEDEEELRMESARDMEKAENKGGHATEISARVRETVQERFLKRGISSRERENNENEDGGEEKEEEGKRMVEEEEEKRTELCRFVGYSRDVIRCCFYRPLE